MESQTCFDLNIAFERWRQELETEPGLTAETRRELEGHVRDSVAALRRRGLRDEEAFWLAWRRVGRPTDLALEFRKIDPRAGARQQALWVAAGLLGLYCWGQVSGIIRILYAYDLPTQPRPWAVVFFNSLWIVPVSALVYLAAKGSGRWWRPRSRPQFISIAAIAFVALQILALAARSFPRHPYNGFGIVSPPMLAMNSLWPVTLIALVAWLMPAGDAEREAS